MYPGLHTITFWCKVPTQTWIHYEQFRTKFLNNYWAIKIFSKQEVFSIALKTTMVANENHQHHYPTQN